MKLGLNLAVFGDRPLADALDRAVALGLDAVELNADGETPLEWLRGHAGDVRRAAAERGLRISALGNHAASQLVGGPHHADTDRFHAGSAEGKARWGAERVLETARAASELEVGTIIGFMGCEDWSRWFPWPDPEGWERMLPAFVAAWSPILDAIGALGVRFAHEPHPKQLAYDLETSLRVLDAFGRRPELGFNLDTGNLSLAGVSPAAFVDALPDRVYHVHAKDLELVPHNLARSGWQAHGAWDRPDRGVRFRVPGWGDVPFRRVFSSLQLAGYEGVVSIEHEDPVFGRDEGVEQAVRFLGPLLPRRPRERRWW